MTKAQARVAIVLLLTAVVSGPLADTAVWNPEFHNPGEGLMTPTLEDAQVCLSHAVSMAAGDELSPVLDEFCALRGLYLLKVPASFQTTKTF